MGGATGQGVGGNGGATEGTGGSGGVTVASGLPGSGSGGTTAVSGGVTGSGGVTRTGGVGGVGGIVGTGGTAGRGGTLGFGGTTAASGEVTGSGGAVRTGGAGEAGGIVGTGGTAGRGGTFDFGGATGARGGTTGSGGVSRTGGVEGLGGIIGIGGMFLTGGTVVSGGTGGTAGTTASGPAYGMPCTTNDDCPSGSTCCDGSSESCDGTRLPSGDGTDSGEFVLSSDGLTVTDTITGLVWQAQGNATGMTWDAAQTYCAALTLGGISSWRMPAVGEFNTIVDFTVHDPAIDPTAFPNTPDEPYWTSSPFADSPGYAWYVDSLDGGSETTLGALSASNWWVRCVRGSRCYPKSRFVVSSGLVTDALTNLVWQQPASTTLMAWADAQTYCSSAGSGFRLPTVKELLSIVDFTVADPGPTINQTAFPNTPTEAFWTSSPDAIESEASWVVHFAGTSYGSFLYEHVDTSMSYSIPAETARVRCVR